ncbi:MAG: RNA polymerase factor sigma-54 [Planctomycetota bacterium]
MELDTRLQQRMDQGLALLPQMLQSIEVLQMATVDLLARIDQELQVNETLEAREREVEVLEPPSPRGPTPDPDDAWEPRGRAGDEDPKLAFLANLPAEPNPLVEHVRQQLLFRNLPEDLSRAVVVLAEHLDERGLLSLPLEQIASMTGLGTDMVSWALEELQSLDPKGLGSRTPVEAMLAQLGDDPDRADIAALLTDHLEALARNRIPEVARAMGLSVDDVQELLEKMRLLSPAPGASLTESVAVGIRPDAFAWLEGGEVRVSLDASAIPDLSINSRYDAMLRDRRTPREVRAYLRRRISAARDLISAVAQRQATLLRVLEALMRYQKGFLRIGRAGIRPLRMRDLAERLSLHASTVSRTVAGKFVQTPRGIFALRDFFDGGSEDEGDVARLAIRQAIAEAIDREDRSMPWSDEDLCKELARKGIQVARRTVTKHRRELGIPSSFERKRHGSRG